jgi:methylated-DNA-[protein]-cysteine S-methyltransferase
VEPRPAVWTTIPGPWGPFHVGATDHGVAAVDWWTSTESFVDRLTRRLTGPVIRAKPDEANGPAAAHLAAALAALEALPAGRPSTGELSFDLADRPLWDRRVLTAVAGIPRGRTASYGDIARRIGAPRAARAVGGAVGRNPIALLIPCHRVIASDGSIGGYGGDDWGSREERLDIKLELLRLEGVKIGDRQESR